MNDVLMRNMFKMVKSFIGEDQIKAIVEDVIKKVIEYKNNIEIDPLNEEAEAALLLYDVGGVIYSAIVILDADTRIIRFEKILSQNQLIEKIIENY